MLPSRNRPFTTSIPGKTMTDTKNLPPFLLAFKRHLNSVWTVFEQDLKRVSKKHSTVPDFVSIEIRERRWPEYALKKYRSTLCEVLQHPLRDDDGSPTMAGNFDYYLSLPSNRSHLSITNKQVCCFCLWFALSLPTKQAYRRAYEKTYLLLCRLSCVDNPFHTGRGTGSLWYQRRLEPVEDWLQVKRKT